jgi:4a-hydroxytetrahydrobiopterin dehydratase
MKPLYQLNCKACEGNATKLSRADARRFLKQARGWSMSAGGRAIVRDYAMKDFVSAVQFIQRITKVAQREDHHPDLHLTGYRKLRIELSTHSVGGLSINDFILAAKINRLPAALKKTQ